MSYMDRKNILSEGIIDKIIKVLTKAAKNAKDRKLKKAYMDAIDAYNAVDKDQEAKLKKLGIKPQKIY